MKSRIPFTWLVVAVCAVVACLPLAWSQQVTLGTGQAVLRIGYDAPSPLS